ncbi:LPD7 domain-containing protein [Ralstonia solanacearum]|uniref:LPD7 domain-containing protein n=1 Tax=Ralstonia solanacearum TaxID=305 RepID=UPI0006DCED09|nr:LPD7 domain-containing protein [Ralstonia solanacearum]
MLIRVRGHNDGIKEYLEKGQKHDREFARDEMDERVILAGDLDLTDALIQSIATDAERYLHITLSFKEDELSREVLAEITRDFEAFMFSAFRPGEYNFYAEAHVPKLKSYADRKTGELVERKVHIHVVVPSENLLTGRRLNPFGKVEQQTRFLEAFQEHVNAKYGLASPRDNRRVAFTDASEMLSRYKGDAFDGANRELKAAILDAMLARDIVRYEDFRALLTEFGQTRTRNAGRGSEYENVKLPGAAKGVNLKEHVFSREFVELSAEGKRAAMEARVHAEYVVPGVPRATPGVFREALAEWHTVRAREVKYLNSGSPFYKIYHNAPADEQRQLLAEREFQFYQPYGGVHGEAVDGRERAGFDERDAWRWAERGHRRGWGDPHRGPGHERGAQAQRQAERDRGIGHGRRGLDVDANRPVAPPGSTDRVRGLPFGGVDGHPARGQELLPADPLLELGVEQAERADALRRSGDFPGAGTEGRGVRLSAEDLAWQFAAARMYEAYQAGDPGDQARLRAAGAAKFTQYRFDPPPGAGGTPAPFGQRPGPRNLADIPSFDAIGLMPFALTLATTAINAINRQSAASTIPPDRLRSPASWSAPSGDIDAPFNSRARAATGREADTVLDQLARDLAEKRATGGDIERAEFRKIKANLDAQQLLEALASSHGLIVEKYAITKGADGGDRIRAGTRNLNVSDFLTKELNLPWADAAYLLRTTYRTQTGRDVSSPRLDPTPALWREFMLQRSSFGQADRAAWAGQLQSERERREAIRSAFRIARSAIAEDPKLSRAQSKAALSTARMTRVERDAALSRAITAERDALRVARPSLEERYLAYLAARGQRGDHAALFELRRLRQDEPSSDPHRLTIRPAKPIQPNAIFYEGPVITHQVQRNGDVEYKRNGDALLVDQGASVRLWQSDRDAIEIALRLAQQKFGPALELTGPQEFQQEVARVAAVARLNVEFADAAINRMFVEHKHALAGADAANRRQEREREGLSWKNPAPSLGRSTESQHPSRDRGDTPHDQTLPDTQAPDRDPGPEIER